MVFSVKTVKDCPVTRSSSGVITFDKALVGQIAGAVRDSIEWIVLLNGKRSADGFEVLVERITVPTQYRGGAHAEMLEAELAADVVGVMHSHHHLGAFFSNTDINQLNPRFPTSVVVAISRNNLGFDYQATGKVMLPCGAMGMVDFNLAVDGAGERFAQQVARGTDDGKLLGDCDRWTSEAGEYDMAIKAACGLTRTVDRPLVFGLDGGDDLIATIETMTRIDPNAKKWNGQGGWSWNGNKDRDRASITIYTGNQSDRADGNTLGRAARKRDKLRNKRNGLQKLERPHPKTCGCSECDGGEISSNAFEQLAERNAGAVERFTYKGGCDNCEIRGERLRWQSDFDSWLCSDCHKYAEDVIARAESEYARQEVGRDADTAFDAEIATEFVDGGNGVLVRIEGDSYVKRSM